jgi:hypothetical protein
LVRAGATNAGSSEPNLLPDIVEYLAFGEIQL